MSFTLSSDEDVRCWSGRREESGVLSSSIKEEEEEVRLIGAEEGVVWRISD